MITWPWWASNILWWIKKISQCTHILIIVTSQRYDKRMWNAFRFWYVTYISRWHSFMTLPVLSGTCIVIHLWRFRACRMTKTKINHWQDGFLHNLWKQNMFLSQTEFTTVNMWQTHLLTRVSQIARSNYFFYFLWQLKRCLIRIFLIVDEWRI